MAGFGTRFLEHLVVSKDIYNVLGITDYSDQHYWITGINEVVYDPNVKLHNEIQWSSPKGTTMVNCEMSYLDVSGKVHLYDYPFAVPSSGDPSKFSMYTVKYDGILQIHRVFESRHQGVDPKAQLWNECVKFRSNQQAAAPNIIAFPFLSWPFPAPMPKIINSLKSGGTSSSSSGSGGTNTPITPITPVTPSAERSFPNVDVQIAKLSMTTRSLDLAASLDKSKGSPAKFDYLNLEKHQPDCALYKRNGEHPMETLEAALTERWSQRKDCLLKIAVTDKKGATFNVTVQARNRYFDVHTCETVLKGLPGSSSLRTYWSINHTAGDLQQTVASGRLQGKRPPQAQAHPFDRPVRDGNAECKAYQAKPHTLGYLSQYLRAGTEAEIDEVWLASPLSSITHPSFEKTNKLALALLRWHQMCLKTKELRICGAFVPPRLGGREGDIDERSAYLHPTNAMTEGIRKEIPRELNLDRVPFTEPYRKNTKSKGQVKIPHHFNLYNEPIYCKTYTPPEVSLWASYQPCKTFRKGSIREAVLASQARKLVDPYFYYGPPEHLQDKGAKLRNIVIGLVTKVYTLTGTWMYDRYDLDETVPISWQEVASRRGWVDRNHQLPQDNRTLDPQDDETVEKENDDFYGPESKVRETWGSHEALDLASGHKPVPEANNESGRWLVALDLTWDGPMPEFEDLRTGVTTATPQADKTAEQFAADTLEEKEKAGEVLDQQSRPAPDISEQSVSGDTVEGTASEILNKHSGLAPDVSEQSVWSRSGEVAVSELIDEQSRPVPDVSEQWTSDSTEEGAASGKIPDEQSGVERRTTGSVSSEGDETTGEAQKEQSGPERQTTASAEAGEAQDWSHSESLDASFAEEDIIESTPPSHGRSTVSSNADDSPAPQRRLPFDNSRANALVRSLARGDSDEEVQARLNRVRQRSPPPVRPHVHNSEDEDSVDNTDTWTKLNQLVPNPKLAKFAETRGGEEEGLDTSTFNQANLGQPPRQAAQGGLPSGQQTSTSLGPAQPQTTSYSTPPSTSQLSKSAPEEFVDDIASAGSAEVTAPAPEIRNRVIPTASCARNVGSSHDGGSQKLPNSEQHDSNASRKPTLDGFGMAATTYSGPQSRQTFTYGARARELLGSTRTRTVLSSADVDRILAENRHLFWPYTELRAPSKTPVRKPKNLGREKKAFAGAALKKKNGLVRQPLNKLESTPRELEEQGRQADLNNGSELSEPQVVDGWLEYMAEREAVEDATDDQPPARASQENGRSADDNPVWDEAPQTDLSWLDYHNARAVSDAVFDTQVLREEAEWAAEIAAQKRDAQNEEDMLNWLQETAALEAREQGEVQRERQTRAATTAALAQYSDVSEIPAPTTPSFSEYFFGSWALTLGAVVEKLPFAVPLS